MSRGYSRDPFFRALDEKTAIGPGAKKILETAVNYSNETHGEVLLHERCGTWHQVGKCPCGAEKLEERPQ